MKARLLNALILLILLAPILWGLLREEEIPDSLVGLPACERCKTWGHKQGIEIRGGCALKIHAAAAYRSMREHQNEPPLISSERHHGPEDQY